MANLDALCGLLTLPTEPRGRPFYFADACAGPGGFTEYMLWREQQLGEECHGFGFTLKQENDWELGSFRAPKRPFRFSVDYGKDGTGDIYVSDNIRHFARKVHQETDGQGVDLLTCDGGFSVKGEENFQEDLLRQLVRGQFLTGLEIIRPGGTFVCKIFDVFTPVTVALVYILYRCFGRVALVKPYTSRPANSERYVPARVWRADHPAAPDLRRTRAYP